MATTSVNLLCFSWFPALFIAARNQVMQTAENAIPVPAENSKPCGKSGLDASLSQDCVQTSFSRRVIWKQSAKPLSLETASWMQCSILLWFLRLAPAHFLRLEILI